MMKRFFENEKLLFAALSFNGALEGVRHFVIKYQPELTALLTILGFSVHDTIVVFDRIRENLKNSRSKSDFETIVGASISQTIVRSVNTSFTVLLVLLAIYFFGGSSVHMFSLTLIIGILFGTYSSICLASPILVTWQKLAGDSKKI